LKEEKAAVALAKDGITSEAEIKMQQQREKIEKEAEEAFES
jgi:hypothetical protein